MKTLFFVLACFLSGPTPGVGNDEIHWHVTNRKDMHQRVQYAFLEWADGNSRYLLGEPVITRMDFLVSKKNE